MATKLKHNSPDPSKYHISEHMSGTMIPVSDKDGNPTGFDPNKPQRVIVDPEYKEGFEMDLTSFAAVKSAFNSQALKSESAEDPSAFYKSFSAGARPKKKIERKTMAGSTTEEFKPIVFETKQAEELVDSGMQSNEKKANELLAEVESRKKLASHPGFQDVGPTFEMLLSHLNQQGAAINALMSKAKEEETEEKENVEEPPAINEVNTNIEFLTGKPQRPQYEAYFEMQKMGTMAARYHAVVPGQDCLALIYDTRFEDGFQYLPPNLGQEKITVSVPKLDSKAFVCSSLGLHWSLGCLDVVILIKHEE